MRTVRAASRRGWLVVALVALWAATIEWALDEGQHGLHDDPVSWMDLVFLPVTVIGILERSVRHARTRLGRVAGRLLQLIAGLVLLWGAQLLALSRTGSGSTEDGLAMSGFWQVSALMSAVVLIVLSVLLGSVGSERGTPPREEGRA